MHLLPIRQKAACCGAGHRRGVFKQTDKKLFSVVIEKTRALADVKGLAGSCNLEIQAC
jgi:hypothetical protein